MRDDVQLEGKNDASLAHEIKHSTYAYNGNFIEFGAAPVAAAPTTTRTNDSDGNEDQNNNSKESHNDYQPMQVQHHDQSQHRRLSTYDYLLLQWNEAVENVSIKAATTTNSGTCCSGTTYFHDWFHQLWNAHSHTTVTTAATISTSPYRHYHTVVHLEEMCFYLQLVDTHFPATTTTVERDVQANAATDDDTNTCTVTLGTKAIILLAIFFHDAVYNVHSVTNEEDSAILWEGFASNTNIIPAQIRQITSYILATKHHTINTNKTIATTTTATSVQAVTPQWDPLELFLDLVMAVLGKDPLAYHQYSILIRREYDFVPADTYCIKRAEILEQFTHAQRIYYTKMFHDAFEQRARHNLQQEIKALRQGTIPS
jgi:predicted metal-dependent HD superfamily phosphohydrolase